MTPYQEIHDQIFLLLQSKLPSFLTYHSSRHTAYVLEQAEIISNHENVSEHDMLLIKTATLFHDIGFIKQYKDHEEAGCVITRKILALHDFDVDDTEEICSMIMATKIPQSPLTHNEMIICDADLEYLGTDLFPKVSQYLYRELHYLDPELDIPAFNRIQVRFISAHTFYTDYCKNHREEKKKENLKELMKNM